jgi:hypothetical protein
LDGSGKSDDATGDGSSFAVLYIANDDGSLYAFSEADSWPLLKQWTALPITDGVRGVDVDPVGGVLFLAHGSDSGPGGSLLAWSLVAEQPIYNRTYDHGVDQLSYGDGRIFMPAGESSYSSTWYIINAADGSPMGAEMGGPSPHNTIYRNGHRYYGGRYANALLTLGIGAGAVGPSPAPQAGVRPFTINAAETRTWLTWTYYRGFSVGDIQSGAILASVNFGPVPGGYTESSSSHGISLSPDGSEVYVIDAPYNQVRVYDGSDNPQLVASIALEHAISPGVESPCAYACAKDGWLLHSRDGRYVFVGDSGDVIDTATRSVIYYLAPLANSRHGFVEVEWNSAIPIGTTTHFGMSY